MKHFFFKGQQNILNEKQTISLEDGIIEIKKELKKVLEVRNLSFLIGSGCSSGIGGIPTMKRLAELFFCPSQEDIAAMSLMLKKLILSNECKQILVDFDIDCD